jgi:TRAP-type C4-dicarboxylate transport system permease small subunit
MGKEKIIGALIFLFALLLMLYYTWGLVLLNVFPDLNAWVQATFPPGSFWNPILAPDPMFLLILPIWLAAVLISIIAIWIGWTMMTTPAPEPLEDFDFDEEAAAEEKTE